MIQTSCATPSNGYMITWAKRAHFQNVRPDHIPPPDENAVDGPSSDACGQMTTVMFGVKQVLVEQTEDKKVERNEK